MKFVLLFLAFVGYAYAAPSTLLSKDFQDFLKVIPLNKLRELAADHLADDPEFQAAMKYIQSKDYKHLVREMKRKPSTKEMRLIIAEAGLDLELIEGIMEAVIDSLQIDVADNQKRSFAKYIEELDEIMPWEKLADLIADKLENSSAFRKFFDAISSERMHMLSDKLMRSQEYRSLYKEWTDMDVPVDTIIETVYALFGWKDPEDTKNHLPQ